MSLIEKDNSLKLLTLRTEYLKNKLKGLVKNIEKRVVKKYELSDKKALNVSWDDWINASLDCFDPNWHKNLNPNEPIPTEILNRLPIPNGELLSLGNWMLTKNIYRFNDLVAKELSKSEFDGMLPTKIMKLEDLCIYVQTDNFDLNYDEKNKIIGVIFSITELNLMPLLVITVYLDSGMSKTIISVLAENSTLDESLGDFVDHFCEDNDVPDLDEVEKYKAVQKKLMNILLWFCQSEPDYRPLVPTEKNANASIKYIKKQPRLFEAQKYHRYIVGEKTSKVIESAQSSQLMGNNCTSNKPNTKKPHLRKAHYHLYWLGKKGSFEKYIFKWIPVTIVGCSLEKN